jgi:hypothetical protein
MQSVTSVIERHQAGSDEGGIMGKGLPYCLKQFNAARTALCRRTSLSETFAFAEALEHCDEALQNLAGIHFGDARADAWLSILRGLVDTSGLDVWDARGKCYAKVELLSTVERATFEEALDRAIRFFESVPGRRCLKLLQEERGLRRAG